MINVTSAQSAPVLGAEATAGCRVLPVRLFSTEAPLPVHTAHMPSAVTIGTKLHAIKSEKLDADSTIA